MWRRRLKSRATTTRRFNENLIRAYYRVPGERYDRLIGYRLIYSGQKVKD